jgi:kinesin family protein 15
MQQKKYSIDERTATLLCGYCRKIIIDQDSREVQGSLKSCIDTAEAKKSDGLTDKAPKVCCDLFSGIFFNFFLYRCSSIILC